MNTICNIIYNIMLELRKKYKSGNAVESIRNAILFGEISGEIAQNEFADSLGISRIPVREALIALEYHGLIE
ncbi:MAG: GntR family transcriptional regulator, partial [Synergistaceae bacterium]|nr:GntR family transcriptional regulator [Synergistaceae bacterium]